MMQGLPNLAATAALPLAQAGEQRRAALLDAIGAALDGVRHRLPQQAALDAAIAPAAALRQHDMLRGWLRALAGALRAGTADLLPRMVPLGPVAAVGTPASAYDVAGMLAMAALAAGCPVLACAVPTPSIRALAALIGDAAAACGLPAAAFALLPQTADADDALLAHRAVRVAICRDTLRPATARLPVLAELDGSEAAFILPCALNGRAEFLGRQLLAQPGACPIVAAIDGDGFIDLREAIIDALATTGGACTERRDGTPLPAGSGAQLLSDTAAGRPAPATFAEIGADVLVAAPQLAAARQGGLLVRCADVDEMVALAWALGPLACASLHVAPDDAALADRLLPMLELAARHIHVNRFGSALRPSREAALDAIGRFRRPVFHHAA